MKQLFSKFFLTTAFVALVCVLSGQANANNLLTNGDFEAFVTLQFGPWGNASSIPGWTAIVDLVEIQSNGTLGGQGGT